MTRAEILSEIKRAEEEAKNIVARAVEAKNQKISEAKAQSREILKKSGEEADEYAATELSKARKIIKEEREKLVQKGADEALDIKNKANKNIAKATKFILTEFERAANA
ncbi:MAG: ATP synthase archaeal subunit H [Candidatus Methanoperedens sp.]